MDMMNKFRIEDYWSCGYVIARRKKLPVDQFPELCGEQVVTASRDLTVVLPDTWCFAHEENDGARNMIGELDLQEHELDGLREWFLQSLKEDKLIWPTLFCTPGTALMAVEKFFQSTPASRELCVLGLGVAKDSANAICEEVEQAASGAEQIYVPECEFLHKQQRLDGNGCSLGFEILCFFPMGGFSCSWFCNYLHREGQQRFGISPGKFGLLQDLDDAKTMAAYCNLPETGAEPGLWVPVLLVEYAD